MCAQIHHAPHNIFFELVAGDISKSSAALDWFLHGVHILVHISNVCSFIWKYNNHLTILSE